MEKNHSSPLSFVFPWLSALTITFVLVENGVEIQVYQHRRQLKNWRPAQLRRVLPQQLIRWLETYHVHAGPQPYPLVRQLVQYLAPLASKKLVVDSSALAHLEETGQPPDFALVWSIDYAGACIVGRYQGADRYLGMGWFQRGSNVWSLAHVVSPDLDALLKQRTWPVQQADTLLNTTIPDLCRFLPAAADFCLITDFAVQVVAADIQSETLRLTIACTHPHVLPVHQIPQQAATVLLAKRAIIRLPHQALTLAAGYLLEHGPSLTLQGVALAHFISDQLPTLQHFSQISEDLATALVQAYPIVSLAQLQPAFTVTHRYEQGVGKYDVVAAFSYQQEIVDADALLAALAHKQRFVRQHHLWFEWPADSQSIVRALRQRRAAYVLRPEEVMGFDTRRLTVLLQRPRADAIQMQGKTSAARAHSLFKQLRYHGVPGGIVGEPAGLASIFVQVCHDLVEANSQASILWLAPSNKKGSVTRALHKALPDGQVTVASPLTLREESTFFAPTWTLVIFQELDRLLDSNLQAEMLARFRWQWALLSLTAQQAAHPSMLGVVHVPEHSYDHFRTHFLFDVEKSTQVVAPGSNAPVSHAARPVVSAPPRKREDREAQLLGRMPASSLQSTPEQASSAESGSSGVAQPVRQRIRLNQQKIASLHNESEQLQMRLAVEEQPSSPSLSALFGTTAAVEPGPAAAASLALQRLGTDVQPRREEEQSTSRSVASPVSRPVARLDAAISTLHKESNHVQRRPGVEHRASRGAESPLDIDEDWRPVLKHWQTEHWEVVICLSQNRAEQLSAIGRRARRPISQLIDEVNTPVDEQLGDLLIDAETGTIFSHLRPTAGRLVHWYLSSREREGFV
ncbi:MAG TPA: hypothetical protein VGF67_04920 [Ktedonobacteraceae bacterium]|jgi:hypothetical protein